MSVIYRCNATFAQDAAPSQVTLTYADRFCMDGSRLRLTSSENLSTYGQSGTTYQTEVANFANVTASGATGNGPSTFTAQGRDGRTYEYGNGGNSQVLLNGTAEAWYLDKVTDRSGNTMTIAYVAPGSNLVGTTVPATISWTPASHGSSSYNYAMQFIYSPLTAPATAGYVAGSAYLNSEKLTNIEIQYQGATVKNYVLGYTASATTSRQTLTQVQECADAAATNCLLPTAIAYQAGTTGLGGATTLVSSQSVAGSIQSTAFDFNGDGANDLIWYDNGAYWVAFGGPSGYGTPANTGISLGASNGSILGNVDGSGTDSILVPVSGTWYYYKWNGSSFVGRSTGVTVETGPYGVQAFLADENGDGLPDLIQAGSDGNLHVRLNTSSGGAVSFASTEITAGSTSQFVWSSVGGARRFDFSGSGQSDLLTKSVVCTKYQYEGHQYVCVQYTYYYYSLHFTGITFAQSLVYSTTSSADLPVEFADFNDDGCTDVLAANALVLSACNGSPAVSLTLPGGTAVMGLDWDGDGRRDVLVQQPSGYIGVVLSTGSGLSSTVINTSIPVTPFTVQYLSARNLNGDGHDGFVSLAFSAPFSLQYYQHNGTGQPADLLSSITDGYGNSSTPTYVSLAQQSGRIYFEYSDATYPEQNFIGPLYVVSGSTFSDPSTTGGTYNQQFFYYGAWNNLQGRGFDGFAAQAVYDSRNQLSDYNYFQRSFPTRGMVNRHDHVQPNGTEIAQSLNTVTYATLDGTANNQRYFPYVSNSTLNQWEVAGSSENGDLVTTTVTNYTFDNYGNATTIAKTVTDNDPGSPYKGDSWTTTTTNTPDVDTTHWCLGLFTQVQVAYTATIGASVTRTKSLTPDTTNCRYTQIVTEPTSSSYKVTEAIGYDSFGNVNSDSVTGIGMTARTTAASWTTTSATTGQLPLSVTDPSGATTNYTYNYAFGVHASLTDPNSTTTNPIVTSWVQDAFGRDTQVTRPDGTYTINAYNDCAATSECLFGDLHALELVHTDYNKDGTIQRQGTDYHDQIDRTIVGTALLPGGSYSRNEQRFDSLGRIAQRAAPCTWSNITTNCTYWTTFGFDEINRTIQMQRPISSSNSTLETTSYAYAGRSTTVTDPNTYVTSTVRDVNGWLRQTKDALAYTVTVAYDAAGSKTGVSDSESHTLWSGTYAYGIAPFNLTATDADLGGWSYTYDALGEVTSWKDAKSQSFSATFDALSRPLTRSEPDLFTQWTWGSSQTSDNIGRLASVCTGLGSKPTVCAPSGLAESRTYDTKARLATRVITPGGGSALTYSYAYSATSGLLNTLTYPTTTHAYALQLQYGYAAGTVSSITDISDSPNVTLWSLNTVNPAGQITQETAGNGVVTNRNYDAVTHWLGSVTAGLSGGSGLENQSYLYDEIGTVTQRQNNNVGLTENFYYDHDYRLSSSKLNGTQNLSATYDVNGNITSRSDVAGGAAWTYDPNHYHEVTKAGSSSFTYSYDANGNAATRNGSTVAWASYNYPTSITAVDASGTETVAFQYGPDRQRWQQNLNSGAEVTNYIGGLLEQVASGGITTWRHYIYAGKEPVAVYSRTSTLVNTWDYFYTDHLGSVAGIANSSGAAVVNESFTAFGARRNPSTWSGAPSTSDLNTIAGLSRQGFTFQTALGQSMGINHFNGRVQDAITGRFLSADPQLQDPGNTQTYNRFSYVNNNPLTMTDPTGFYETDDVNGGSGGGLPMLPEVVVHPPNPSPPDSGSTSGAPIPIPTVYVPPGGPLPPRTAPPSAEPQGNQPQGNQPQGNQPPEPQGTPHNYVISRSTQCSASDAFNQLTQPGMSAPGAPAAQEGFTPNIPLPGITSPNPISQFVNSSSMTIVNTTLPGHAFYPGTVVIQVSSGPNNTSVINVTGSGTGNYPMLNDIVGEAIFGTIAGSVADVCDPSMGP